MSQLFERTVKLALAAPLPGFRASTQVTEITDLRVRFSVVKTLGKEPNTAEITVTNLAQHSRAALQAVGTRVHLYAGYRDTLALVFVGDISHVDHQHEGPNWESKLVCGDGLRALLHARVNQAFKPGTSVSQIVKYILGQLGVDVGNAAAQLADLGRQYTQGYSLHGPASRELDKLLKAAGYDWSIQNGALQILRPGQVLPGEAVVLSPSTGLIDPQPALGGPEKKDGPPVLKARSLLQPALGPGRRMVLEDTRLAGRYRILKTTCTGDTAGGDWQTDVEAVTQ